MVAEVIINRSAKKLNKTFDYNVPKELEELVLVGSRVLVPFGNSKKLEDAYVVGLKETTTYKLKDIVEVKDSLAKEQIELAKWMAKRYFCNVSDCIRLMMVPGAKNTKSKNRNPLKNKEIQRTTKLNFTKEQQDAYSKIEKALIQKKYEEFLLYGVTGSRKNRNIFAIN